MKPAKRSFRRTRLIVLHERVADAEIRVRLLMIRFQEEATRIPEYLRLDFKDFRERGVEPLQTGLSPTGSAQETPTQKMRSM